MKSSNAKKQGDDKKDSLALAEFLYEKNLFAIVGATENESKYGYKVFVDLKEKGYNVIPVNPKYKQVAEVDCYPNLLSMDERPDVVVLIVGQENGKKVVQDCADLDLDKIWFQPGSESESVVALAQENRLKIITGLCIMTETKDIK